MKSRLVLPIGVVLASAAWAAATARSGVSPVLSTIASAAPTFAAAAPTFRRPGPRPPAVPMPLLDPRSPAHPAQPIPVTCDSPTRLPPGIERIADIPYGDDARQRFDVYRPIGASVAPRPVLLMVHGGGWSDGDKAMLNVVMNKTARWVPKGWILVSVDYRMLPDTPPLEQARDVARAIARAQQLAPGWGGDPQRFVLMGHSAGAHLVSLLNADMTLAYEQGALPWRAVVALDSAAYDVPRIMRAPHLPLYDDAFGSDPAQWPLASPIDRLHAGGAPMLGICSSLRVESCPQATDFAARAIAVGTSMRVVPEPLSHEQINECLGLASDYTRVVDHMLSNAVLPAAAP